MPVVEVLLVSMEVSCRDSEGGPFWTAREDETEGWRLTTARRGLMIPRWMCSVIGWDGSYREYDSASFEPSRGVS
jgi:hypothetical protein